VYNIPLRLTDILLLTHNAMHVTGGYPALFNPPLGKRRNLISGGRPQLPSKRWAGSPETLILHLLGRLRNARSHTLYIYQSSGRTYYKLTILFSTKGFVRITTTRNINNGFLGRR